MHAFLVTLNIRKVRVGTPVQVVDEKILLPLHLSCYKLLKNLVPFSVRPSYVGPSSVTIRITECFRTNSGIFCFK